MVNRRSIISALAFAAVAAPGMVQGQDKAAAAAPVADRSYAVDLLTRIAEPVLSSMAASNFVASFQIELSPTWNPKKDPRFAYLECFGRLMAGMAPWLGLGADETPEGRQRGIFIKQAQAAIAHAVDPAHPDYMLWTAGTQPLVDSAYLSQALLRAPSQLWEPLDPTTKLRLVSELQGLRRVKPPANNWLLFAATNEAFLLSIGAQHEQAPIDRAIKRFQSWYLGDGWYGDGEHFRADYYNSYVIQPMLLQLLEVAGRAGVIADNALLPLTLQRMQRLVVILERLISPEGTYPPLGRSLACRTAAFQPLALLAWRKQLPDSLPEGQVRAALTAVHRRIFDNPSNFDERGFLRIGFAGAQPEIGDSYFNNGSAYMTAASFLALGLPATDPYWTAPPLDWTAKRAFANAPFPPDHALKT